MTLIINHIAFKNRLCGVKSELEILSFVIKALYLCRENNKD